MVKNNKNYVHQWTRRLKLKRQRLRFSFYFLEGSCKKIFNQKWYFTTAVVFMSTGIKGSRSKRPNAFTVRYHQVEV